MSGDDRPARSRAGSALRRRSSETPAPRRRTTSASAEDYLAAIYALGNGGGVVIAARLAREVGVSAPAVSEAIGRLSRAGYVQVDRGKRLQLTIAGRDVAAAVIRRRRLVERWLTHALGLDAAEAREEAHRLEHVFSSRVERRLARIIRRAVKRCRASCGCKSRLGSCR